MTRSSGGLSTMHAGRLPEPKQGQGQAGGSVRLQQHSCCVARPTDHQTVQGKIGNYQQRPNASRPTERVLRPFWQALLCCCGAPSPSPSLLADSRSHCRTSPYRTHLSLWSSAVASSRHPHSHRTGLWSSAITSNPNPHTPSHRTGLWSSAVTSRPPLPHDIPLPPDRPLVISCHFKAPTSPAPLPPDRPLVIRYRPAPPTGPFAAARHQPPPPDLPSRPLPSLHLGSDAVPGPPAPPFVIQEREVRSLFRIQNPRKTSGPDNVSPATLRSCADQLAPVFTALFNKSLEQCQVPRCFKTSTIVPVPKKPSIASLNDYRPVALTSVVMKVFERLVLRSLKAATDHQLDPHQFAYRANRSVDDAIALALHHILQHLETSGTYARVLFVDFSLMFNTIIPLNLFNKLIHRGVERSLCVWILDFLQDRPQSVRIGKQTSKEITLNVGAPQGCVLSPLLFSLFTNDSVVIRALCSHD